MQDETTVALNQMARQFMDSCDADELADYLAFLSDCEGYSIAATEVQARTVYALERLAAL